MLLTLLAALAAGTVVARHGGAARTTDALARPLTAPTTTGPGSQTAIAIITRDGYRLSRPPGWQDHTATLSGHFGRTRADLVLTGGVTGGFAATITIIHARPASRQVPLTQLPRLVAAELGKVPQGRLVGTTHRTAVAGQPAVTYDFVFRTAGSLVRGRQIVTDRDGHRYFLTCEARSAAFAPTVAAFAQALQSWRWQ